MDGGFFFEIVERRSYQGYGAVERSHSARITDAFGFGSSAIGSLTRKPAEYALAWLFRLARRKCEMFV